MKFKVAVIGLLTAILAVCCFTSYKLIQESEKQKNALTEIACGLYYLTDNTYDTTKNSHKDRNDTLNAFLQAVQILNK